MLFSVCKSFLTFKQLRNSSCNLICRQPHNWTFRSQSYAWCLFMIIGKVWHRALISQFRMLRKQAKEALIDLSYMKPHSFSESQPTSILIAIAGAITGRFQCSHCEWKKRTTKAGDFRVFYGPVKTSSAKMAIYSAPVPFSVNIFPRSSQHWGTAPKIQSSLIGNCNICSHELYPLHDQLCCFRNEKKTTLVSWK